jgi:hypothetical protein
MAWQENSIMASKGVARGKRGIRHMITEADQGKYHYVYGPLRQAGPYRRSGRRGLRRNA